ncbi:DUF983 domain-containing protein [Lacinutrix sp. MedPE-SW]|uniref:DUF983 domain-containing protein n=1 Tax=Lacinutrix sp. MedPE-SW TaxID=1860087 RepID=UPI00091C401E|nr:DUF983 domain-containing protein [Lacinutrix sp. MedPE-SW]OIQ23842.1 MAG: DUF983 domain-containing protein [Lacinutrix sp. MedPE-SW]
MKLLKGTKINSILTGSCPVCQNESMYSVQNPYKVTSTLTMEEQCSHCNTKYQIEPSFFFGAMYVSYPVGLIFGGFSLFLSYIVLELSLLTSYIILILFMLLCLPIILRLSRNIWINIFMKYDKSKAE